VHTMHMDHGGDSHEKDEGLHRPELCLFPSASCELCVPLSGITSQLRLSYRLK